MNIYDPNVKNLSLRRPPFTKFVRTHATHSITHKHTAYCVYDLDLTRISSLFCCKSAFSTVYLDAGSMLITSHKYLNSGFLVRCIFADRGYPRQTKYGLSTSAFSFLVESYAEGVLITFLLWSGGAPGSPVTSSISCSSSVSRSRSACASASSSLRYCLNRR